MEDEKDIGEIVRLASGETSIARGVEESFRCFGGDDSDGNIDDEDDGNDNECDGEGFKTRSRFCDSCCFCWLCVS